MRACFWKAALRPRPILLGLLVFILFSPACGQAEKIDFPPGTPKSASPNAPGPTPVPSPQNLSTSQCDACTLKIGQEMPPYAVRFKLRSMPNNRRVIEELRVSRDDKPGWAQSLPVHGMTPVTQNQEFFIGTADINFDGYNDLLLATSRGVANTYADYWLFVPPSKSFPTSETTRSSRSTRISIFWPPTSVAGMAG